MERVDELQEKIRTHGKEIAFGMVFDSYNAVVHSDFYVLAKHTLPSEIERQVNLIGLSTSLDWQRWGEPSFFGVMYVETKRSECFYVFDEERYLRFLIDVEDWMWQYTKQHPDFYPFSNALCEMKGEMIYVL